jgi:hypothetical protein
MTLTYTQRRERITQLAEQLPLNLRGRISLRNVEAVSHLPPETQQTLAHALDAGLLTLSAAVRYLKAHPQVSTNDLLTVCQAGAASCRHNHRSDNTPVAGDMRVASTTHVALSSAVQRPSHSLTQNSGETTVALPEDIQTLAALMQACFPDLNPMAADALIHSPTLTDILPVVAAHRQAFASSHLRSDFVIVILYALMGQSQTELQQIIAANPAYQQAIRQSGAANLAAVSIP